MAKKKKIKPPVYPVRSEDQKLFDACRTLNYQRIMAAIQAGGDVNALDSKHEMSVIDVLTDSACVPEYRSNTAIQENVLKIIKQLLVMGAKPDGTTYDNTPLHVFSWQLYDWNVCRELIRAGAKINRILDERGTILDYVADEIQFLEITDEENRTSDLAKLEYLYTQMVRHGALHYSELKEKQEKNYDLGRNQR